MTSGAPISNGANVSLTMVDLLTSIRIVSTTKGNRRHVISALGHVTALENFRVVDPSPYHRWTFRHDDSRRLWNDHHQDRACRIWRRRQVAMTATTTAEIPGALTSRGDTLFIGGRWSRGVASYERVNPCFPNRRTSRYSTALAAKVVAAYRAAAAAQPGWAATPAPRMADVLRRPVDLLEQRVAEAAWSLTADMGKAVRDARAVVLRSAAIFRYFAGELLQRTGDTYASADTLVLLLTIQESIGVLFVLSLRGTSPLPFPHGSWPLALGLETRSCGSPPKLFPAAPCSSPESWLELAC